MVAWAESQRWSELPTKGKNLTDFWTINTWPFLGARFVVCSEALCVRPILSSCPLDAVVLDLFVGSGTTMKVALELGRSAIGIELNARYTKIVEIRVYCLKGNDIIRRRAHWAASH
ncbi:MAG: hypothetical protein COT13_04340 [Chloroflexi bacterium CG08_land_8_20_14_0_20_45_12]|nr:MAG: hypothetical protein AUK00_05800 [Dehalococcoidia bacterium CG2_30_46_9]PIU23196.1 MAG: hypothetical protein COT13_04340 [Chloroflexi bacterium CG08_land_8_20_14_0_20_45_12]